MVTGGEAIDVFQRDELRPDPKEVGRGVSPFFGNPYITYVGPMPTCYELGGPNWVR